jgi:multidrug efflux pump
MSQKLDKNFGIATWAIENKMTVYVISFIILIGGILSYYAMPRENFPEIIETKIYISSVFPGNSAEDVEKLITKPLEEEFNNISGVTQITSNTLDDYSTILVEFDEGIKVEDAKQKVKDQVDKAKSSTDWPTIDNAGKVEPNVFDLNIAEEFPILNLNIIGNYPAEKLKEYAEYLEEKIERLPQIKEAAIRGAEDKEVEIAVDMYRMAASKVSFDDIINAIKYENKTVSGGNITETSAQKNIRIIGEVKNTEEFQNIIVKKQDGVIYLRDIATVSFKEKERTTFARTYGEPVIMLDIKKRSGKNMVEAVDAIKEIVKTAKKDYLPQDIKITFANDQSVKTLAQVDDLVNNIIFGVILVVFVLMFFLGFRNAMFVGIAIPMSMLMSFMILAALGITLNTMVLFALVMGLGMLVDNGIVVVENVYTLYSQGMSLKNASKQGIGEIAWPVISSTATTLAAFFPLGLWPGTMGKFMVYFPMTLSIVLFSSLFVALVVNAMMCAEYMQLKEGKITKKFLKNATIFMSISGFLMLFLGYWYNNNFFKAFGNLTLFFLIMLWVYKYFLADFNEKFQNTALVWLETTYKKFLEYALKGYRPIVYILATFFLLILSFVLVRIAKPNVLFFPENEPNQIMVYLEYPEGTNIKKTNALSKEIEQKVLKVVEKYQDKNENFMVETAIAQVGRGSGNPQTEGGATNDMPHRGKVVLSMKDFKYRKGVKSSDVLEEVRSAVQDYAGVSIIVEKERNGPPAGYPISIELSGEDYSLLLKEAEKMKDFIDSKNVAGVEQLKIDVNKIKPGMSIKVDVDKAGLMGVSSAQVGMTLRRAIYGEKASVYKEGKDDYEVNVRLKEEQRNDENAVFNQPLTFRDQSTGRIVQIPISSMVSSDNTYSFNTIKRKNLKRVITIYSNVTGDFNGNDVLANIQKELQNYKVDEKASYKFTGEQEKQAENMSFLIKALLIALGGIVLILVAQFNSVSKPAIIMIAVLLSFAGVFLGMVFFKNDFVIIMTMMGIISLAGIVVNNAIVLIDYTQLLIDRKTKEIEEKGNQTLSVQDYFEAVVEAGRSRLRPVLLTAITTVLGLIPLAIGFNIDFFSLFISYDPKIYIGGDNVMFWGPLAKTVIYGLTFATFLTLVIVPLMYFVLNKSRIKRKIKKHKKIQSIVE